MFFYCHHSFVFKICLAIYVVNKIFLNSFYLLEFDFIGQLYIYIYIFTAFPNSFTIYEIIDICHLS